MSSRSADSIGVTFLAMAWSWSLVSAEERLKNTEPTFSSSLPLASSASTVLAKVAGSWLALIASTSARRSAMPFSSAGRKCSSVIAPNGGTPNGVVHSTKNGFCSAAVLTVSWAKTGSETATRAKIASHLRMMPSSFS